MGKDLQAGNLAQAQTDLVTLEQNSPFLHAGSAASATTGNSASGNNNPIAQAFSQLAKDLQAGNVTAAQQDFSSIQQDFHNSQSQAPTQAGRHHH